MKATGPKDAQRLAEKATKRAAAASKPTSTAVRVKGVHPDDQRPEWQEGT